MKRTLLERWVLIPALVAYVGLLALAAWRHEIRPAVFDRVTDFARATLGLAGIPPGIAVFSTDSGSAPDAKIAEICLEVRGLREGGAEPLWFLGTRIQESDGIAHRLPPWATVSTRDRRRGLPGRVVDGRSHRRPERGAQA